MERVENDPPGEAGVAPSQGTEPAQLPRARCPATGKLIAVRWASFAPAPAHVVRSPAHQLQEVVMTQI